MQETNPEKEIKEPIPDKEKVTEKVPERLLYEEKKEELEKREVLVEREKAIREKLEKEIAEMKLTPELEVEARKKAEEIESLDEKGKLQRLLGLAEENGLTFAVGVAKDMKDPFTLDAFHDILAKDELYKKFEK